MNVYMVEIQQRGIEFLRSVQKVGTSYRALGLAERSSTDTTLHVCATSMRPRGRLPAQSQRAGGGEGGGERGPARSR